MTEFFSILSFFLSKIPNKDSVWKPTINSNLKRSILNKIFQSITELKIDTMDSYKLRYCYLQLGHFIFEKLIEAGNVNLVLLEIPFEVDINKIHYYNIRPVDKKKLETINYIFFNSKDFNIPFSTSVKNEIYKVNDRFNKILLAIVETINFNLVFIESIKKYDFKCESAMKN